MASNNKSDREEGKGKNPSSSSSSSSSSSESEDGNRGQVPDDENNLGRWVPPANGYLARNKNAAPSWFNCSKLPDTKSGELHPLDFHCVNCKKLLIPSHLVHFIFKVTYYYFVIIISHSPFYLFVFSCAEFCVGNRRSPRFSKARGTTNFEFPQIL